MLTESTFYLGIILYLSPQKMRPPICAICQTDFREDMEGGGLVSFRLSEEDRVFNEKIKARQMVGHPKGQHWFCSRHIDRARALQHLSWEEARLQFSPG